MLSAPNQSYRLNEIDNQFQLAEFTQKSQALDKVFVLIFPHNLTY